MIYCKLLYLSRKSGFQRLLRHTRKIKASLLIFSPECTLEQQFGTSISRLKVIEVIGAPHDDFSTLPGCCLHDKRPFLKETILRVYVEKDTGPSPTT